MGFLVGLLAAFGAAICFGVQYVPVKRHKLFDGTTFQWFMCSGILFVGFLIAVCTGDIERGCPPLVVFGGALWGLSNFAVLPLVKLLGIGLGFSLYHFVNMIVAYVIGRLGLFGVPRLQEEFDGSRYICDAGCVLILISFGVMVSVETEAASEGQTPPSLFEMSRTPTSSMTSVHANGDGERGSRVEGDAQNAHPAPADARAGSREAGRGDAGAVDLRFSTFTAYSEEMRSACPTASRPFIEGGEAPDPGACVVRAKTLLAGVALAIIAGGLAGVQSVPATIYNHAHPEDPPTAVVFPQCVGIWGASNVIYLGYASVARMRRWPVPHAVIRPAYLSGSIWAVGFMLMIIGIRELGFSVGYTLDAVGPIAVASLLSICWFKEITQRRQIIIYCAAEALQFIGVVLITAFGKQ